MYAHNLLILNSFRCVACSASTKYPTERISKTFSSDIQRIANENHIKLKCCALSGRWRSFNSPNIFGLMDIWVNKQAFEHASIYLCWHPYRYINVYAYGIICLCLTVCDGRLCSVVIFVVAVAAARIAHTHTHIFGSRDNPIIVNIVAGVFISVTHLMLMVNGCKFICTRNKFIHVTIKFAAILSFFGFLACPCFVWLFCRDRCLLVIIIYVDVSVRAWAKTTHCSPV